LFLCWYLFCCLQTTAHTICWTLFLLATHPEAEARLCAELDSLGLLASPGKPRPAALQWEHLSQVSHTALSTAIGNRTLSGIMLWTAWHHAY
jgi:cytochrome P450